MADPFSAAGFDDDIAHIQGKLDGLRKTLENLEKHIMPRFRSSNAREVEDVDAKIVSCCNGIHKLRAILTKCQSSGPISNTVQGKAYRLIQKTFYPFKKTTLLELNASVTSLQENVHSSLLSLMLWVWARNLMSSLLKSRTRSVVNDQRENLSVLSSDSQARNEAFNDFRREFQNVASDLGAIRDRITMNQVTSASTIPIQARSLENLPRLQEGIERLPEILEKMFKNTFEDHWQKTSELLHSSQLTRFQRNVAMQDHVSGALLKYSNTKSQKSPFNAIEVTWDARTFAERFWWNQSNWECNLIIIIIDSRIWESRFISISPYLETSKMLLSTFNIPSKTILLECKCQFICFDPLWKLWSFQISWESEFMESKTYILRTPYSSSYHNIDSSKTRSRRLFDQF